MSLRTFWVCKITFISLISNAYISNDKTRGHISIKKKKFIEKTVCSKIQRICKNNIMHLAALTWWLFLTQTAFPAYILKKKKKAVMILVSTVPPTSQVVWSWSPAAGGFLRALLKRQCARVCSWPRLPWCLFWTWHWGQCQHPAVRHVPPRLLWCSLLVGPEFPTCVPV